MSDLRPICEVCGEKMIKVPPTVEGGYGLAGEPSWECSNECEQKD